MNVRLTFIITILLCGLMATVNAQANIESATQICKSTKQIKELQKQFRKERGEMRAQILEKRASLLRLAIQDNIDVKQVQVLVKEISELKTSLRNKCDEFRTTMQVLNPGSMDQKSFGAKCRFRNFRGKQPRRFSSRHGHHGCKYRGRNRWRGQRGFKHRRYGLGFGQPKPEFYFGEMDSRDLSRENQ